MKNMDDREISSVFEKYRIALNSQPLSAVWRGYGSAVFLEFGPLSSRLRRDGFGGNSQGNYSVMIEWSWRIENENTILCGSWSDEEDWETVFKSLIGRQVEDATVFGRLPEISISLAGGLYIASFMTAAGQPEWSIFDNITGADQTRFISVKNGKIVEG
jgi:hypothetical protein